MNCCEAFFLHFGLWKEELEKSLTTKKTRMKTLLKVALAVIPLVSICACTYTFFEDAERNKTAVVSRNLIVISSETPADVRVSYYEVSDGTSNKLVTKTIQTPYILDLGRVVVKYDSVNLKQRGGGNKVKERYKKLDVGVLLGKGGAEYLKLENLSEQPIKLAIVGTQRLVANDNVIESQPNPIYRGVPLLYLLKPESAPNKDFYFRTIKEYERGKGASTIKEGDAKKIALYSEQLGEFGKDVLPFSVERIVALYENDNQHLYLDYMNYSLEFVGYENENREFMALKENGLELFRVIQPHQVVYNNGTFPLLSLNLVRQQRRVGDSFLVQEDW